MESPNWLKTAAWCAAGAVVSGLLLWLLPRSAAFLLGLGLVTFVVVACLNPKFLYRRLCVFVLSVWGGVVGVGGFEFVIPEFHAGAFHFPGFRFAVEGADWAFHAVVFLLASTLLRLDFTTMRACNRHKPHAPPSPDFPVDSGGLTRAQKHDLAVRQVEAKRELSLFQARRAMILAVSGVAGVALVSGIAIFLRWETRRQLEQLAGLPETPPNVHDVARNALEKLHSLISDMDVATADLNSAATTGDSFELATHL